MDLLKFQITNPKKQTNNNDRNSKFQTKKTIDHSAQALAMYVEPIWNLMLEIWNLFEIWCLEFVILDTAPEHLNPER
jgi:hypothetical protein